jgi:hypothetical protein
MLLDNKDILVTKPVMANVFTFSNSGRGGKRNWFAMTASQLSGCLSDLLACRSALPMRYEEKEWRRIFADNLTDDVSRTVGAVQTLPLFEILAKIIHYSRTEGPRTYKSINLEPQALRQAISELDKLSID